MQNIKRFLRGNIYNKIKTLATIPENTITQKDLIGMKNIPYKNRILTATQFLHNEMPIRFARRIVDLEDLPFNIYQNDPITNISECYSESLEDILNLPYPTDFSQCSQFFNITQKIVDRHSHTLDSMSNGINQYNQYNQNTIIDDDFNLNIFLDKFNRNRTKTRLLLHNYLEYYQDDEEKEKEKENPNRIGILNLKCNLENILNNVIGDLENITMTNHMEFPSVEIDIDNLDFIYVDSYLHYTFLEILKNSVKAINDLNKTDNGTIKITTSHKDKNMYILKISDNGIGIKPENLNKIWNFSYTTATTNPNQQNGDTPISGFGYGLSISKIILKTFADHIKVYSEYQKGTDVYIFLDLKNNWII